MHKYMCPRGAEPVPAAPALRRLGQYILSYRLMLKLISLSLSLSLSMYIYIYIYVYTYRERERKREI